MNTSMILLFFIIVCINIIQGYQCRLYLYSDPGFSGSQYGPFDVGTWRYGPYPNDAISSMLLYAEGYWCYARLYRHVCHDVIVERTASPFGSASDTPIGNFDELSCLDVWSVATPNPTKYPSETPSMAPSTSPTISPSTSPTIPPTSSCLDYNNETSSDGNNEIREFNYKNIANINNYHIDKNTVLEFNASYDTNYRNKLIECAGSDCIIQCHDTSSCHKTNIKINNIINKTVVLLCYDEYSCSGSSITTKWSASITTQMVNINVVCMDEYSCIDMNIYLTNISSFNLYCLQYGSCLDVNISIDSNNNETKQNDGIISCVSLNSCDNLWITTNSNKTQLIMYAFSDDVTLNNGAGYFYEDNNILCNNDRYLRYETSMIGTDENITDSILNEYDNQIWPCSGVHVICGMYSCDMSFSINTPQFLSTLTSGCYWINMQYFMRLECQGGCISSPTPPPTSSPTISPTYPTNAPTFSPTIAPSTAPSKPPSTNPSVAPTMIPSVAPTQIPSANPTATPSVAPTMIPSLAPTNTPSIAPTDIPTMAPTSAPTVAPSNNPTISPTNVPTTAPSLSPTRYPTLKMEDIYPAKIDITYIIYDLTSENIELLEDYTTYIVPDIVEIIESNYFVQNDVEYKDFVVNVLNINGFGDLSNINLKEDFPVIMESAILSKADIAGILVKKSKSTIFESDVTDDLRIFFANNSDLHFEIQDSNLLRYRTDESSDDEESYTLMIILAIIVLIGFLCSVFVKWSNDRKDAVIDNAKWIAPLLFALQIYDFISDINLSYDILTNALSSSRDIILWCGIFSVLCTVIPFLSNLYYGITIKTQQVVKNNKRAETYFTDKMAIFISLIVSCGGCYPALMIVSSRIFNSDAFNSGLTKHELNRLSKIKIRSTITMENGPQLLISIIYSINIGKISNATFLSLVASSLSVILAISSFYANKLSRKDAEIRMYDLKFYNQNGCDTLTQIEKEKIKRKKGRKQELEKKIAAIFGSSSENIEIASVTVTNYGFIMYISHHIPKKDLAEHNAAYNSRYNKMKKSRMRMVVGAKQYLYHLYQTHIDEINKVFRTHFFGNNDDKFIVEFMMDNNDDNNIDLFGAETIYEFEGNYNNNNNNNNNDNVEMTELKQKMDEIYKNMELIIKQNGINDDNEEKEEDNQLLTETNFTD